jgi:hypothetical protein
MLGQISTVNSSHHKKRKVNINYCMFSGNEGFSEFN